VVVFCEFFQLIFLIPRPVAVTKQLQIYEIVNKKLPCVVAQGSFYIFLTDLLRKVILYLIVQDHLFPEAVCTGLG